MRLIPAEAGKFKHGRVYVKFSRVNRLGTHHLTENDHGRWLDEHDGVSMTEDSLLDGWYLIDPSDDPDPVAPEPERDEFWEKCYLAALTGFCAASDQNISASTIEKWSREQADACVAERKSSEGAT